MCMAKITGKNLISCQILKMVFCSSRRFAPRLVYLGPDQYLMADFIKTFFFLFAVIDPLGSVPVFLHATRSFDDAAKKKIAIRASILAAMILAFFIICGQLIMEAMEISIPAFRIAGGLVLFLFSLTMIFGQHGKEDNTGAQPDARNVTVFPLAMPSIASPGAILAVVLLTDNHVFTVIQQAKTLGILLVVIFITCLLLLAARKIQERIGDAGINIISRVMGLLLAAFAIQSILDGIKEFFSL